MRKVLFAILILSSLWCYSQSRNISLVTKKVVFARDDGSCQCCGNNDNLEYDHIIPFSCGGNNEPSNIQLLCQRCNRSKSNSCFCKIHKKQVGKDCCQDTSTRKNLNTLDQAVRCLGTTQKGLRCKNQTKNSNGRCHFHQKS